MSIFAAESVTNYSDFLLNLKDLETYAHAFAEQSGKDSGELVLNFIRTGVDRYQTGTWETLAGKEITEFTDYVESQDTVNGTTVMNLRDIVVDDFILPNGNQADFAHMFGTMNISYLSNENSADLSGWAGDICDLIYFSKEYGLVPDGTLDETISFVLENCFGVNADNAFGWDDFYGDMDAFYFIKEYKAGNGSFSELMEKYYTDELDDTDRAVYFLNNRFAGVETKDEVRTSIYNTYRTNVGIQVLEADRNISEQSTLRQACCYAFADYLYSKAEGLLIGGGTDVGTGLPENGYYSVFSSNSSLLAPGITQTISYATTTDKKQMVYYVAKVDVKRDDVTIMANYKDNDPSKGWGMQRVEDQTVALVNNYSSKYENFSAVVATNGDGFNTTTGKPGGLLIMDGVEWNPVDKDGFFAILKDGSAVIGTQEDYDTYKTQIQEAIGGFGAVLVKDGEIVTTNNSGRASRTAIGINADGEVIMMVLDGRQEPFSCGGTMVEIAQIMLEAGCVNAVNLDGGGSTTYMSKPEGEDNIRVVNRPSDGYARSVATSLVAVSTAKPSTEFDRAILKSDYDYVTAGTSMTITASGVSNTGFSAPIPENAYWSVSDNTVGTISDDGIFTAVSNGDVEINLMLGDVSVGSKTIHVVVPDTLEIEGGKVTAIFGVPVEIPIIVLYKGNEVAYNESDIILGLVEENGGTFDGMMFTGNEEAGLRNLTAAALFLPDDNVGALFNISLYYQDEAIFDFDNVTAGNRKFAWVREVSNATTSDNLTYNAIDPDENYDISYNFALDMTQIEIPERLEDIVYMLPGADLESANAFGFLLQLAERVSVLSEVRITAQFDADVDVDISELKIINDYFTLTSKTLDENNKLTMVCNWIDRTEPIDPATANPICILAGLKITPKSDAEWTDDELIVINSGEVSFDIYLRASSLYSFAQKPENQKTYGLYPYSTNETGYEGGTESGAHFKDSYADFQDSFILDRSLRQEWYKIDGNYFYFVDHVPQTGIQWIPSRDDSSENLFYEFDENGACIGTVSGVIEYNGELYYSIQGKKSTGWLSTNDAQGNAVDYYFDPVTGAAVDGEQTIAGYDYIFTEGILTQGDLVTDAKGTRYRWAGQWVQGKWFEVDGNLYHTKTFQNYVTTGYASVVSQSDLQWRWHLFDENGVFQKDYNGLYRYNGEIYYLTNGVRDSTKGLVFEDGYYYYISSSNAKAVKNGKFWLTNTHGIIPIGYYNFDENGHIIDPPVIDPGSGDTPEILDGIVERDGEYYYYQNGEIDFMAGLVKLTDDEGKDFYVYVRSSTGTLAKGRYWPSIRNGLLESGAYDFGEDGRYYPPETPVEPDTPEEPEVLDGIVEKDGKLYYYEDGVRDTNAGLVKLTDEDGKTFYIYVRSSTGTLVTGRYWPSLRNDLLPAGYYEFDENGRYYPPVTEEPETPNEPEVLDGIVEKDGKLYYYENGVRDINAGLVKLTDEEGKTFYIYVRSSTGTLATGRCWPSLRNDLLPAGYYEFDENGRYYPGE